MNKDLLNDWFEYGLMSFDGEKAAWTQLAKKLIPQAVRQSLMKLAKGGECLKYEKRHMEIHGFNTKGIYCGTIQKTRRKITEM